MNSDKLCIDLCSGLGGFSRAFVDAGWEVVTVDIDPKFKPTICADAGSLPLKGSLAPSVILASPPCEKFSVMSIGHYWKDGRPGPKAREAGRLVKRILAEIERLRPGSWMMENPDGMLKRIIGRPRWIITMCQYGASYQKRTALWGTIERFRAKKCHNYDSCHTPSPRGNRLGGLQNIKTAAERALIPYGLSQAVLEAVSAEKERE